jgi:hypothetical protein
MDVEKVKFLIRNVELLLDEIKGEVYGRDFKIGEPENTEVSTDALIRQMFPISDT